MKKLLIIALGLFSMMWVGSCNKAQQEETATDTIDTVLLSSEDSIGVEFKVVGEAYDGAERSIIIITDTGDTLSYDLPEDEDADIPRQSWRIGDTVTVKYVKVKTGNIIEDSVTALLLGRN